MLEFGKATEIAKEYNPNYNAVQEYADAYEFFIDDGIVRMGGSDCSIIIEKSSGKLIRWRDYFMNSNRTIVEIGEPKPLD